MPTLPPTRCEYCAIVLDPALDPASCFRVDGVAYCPLCVREIQRAPTEAQCVAYLRAQGWGEVPLDGGRWRRKSGSVAQGFEQVYLPIPSTPSQRVRLVRELTAELGVSMKRVLAAITEVSA